ncbi:UDP-glucose--hexose-1-phosphate uridylyltransferase [Loigolactobacillus zhaoyuanensis]|uniref:Galactose-1-phosphate uridylyltransferase n=1 Tax=Loigolactobacillus zhaoyuanensis TaxID=2486017 RepID=A0ABW8U9B4_9LACO
MADLAAQFVSQILKLNRDYQPLDRFYLTNRVYALVGEQLADDATPDLLDLTAALVEAAVANEKIGDTPTEREILDAALMDLLTPRPSTVNGDFWNQYQVSPQAATDYFYQLSRQNDYIKTRAIAKNIEFPVTTDYGDLEMTINLSKPEKDPKAIAAAQQQAQTDYPKCQLCMENEGYRGRLGYPARSNHRIIRFTLGGETWGFQYSPYAYFSEHAIFLNQEHRPMVINQHTFTNLLEIVRMLPHYFVGSNADLPIVGGSMLTHDHYQGGRHVFPMMKAPLIHEFKVAGVQAGIVKWPMATIRLISDTPEKLVNAATTIHNNWCNYSDESVDVRAYTEQTRHHTVTPIAYRNGQQYVLDIVLRDNQTSAQYPDGIFHPHPDVQHIKKENIGLIEVMGRAILPARLKTEVQAVADYLIGQPVKIADYHKTWVAELQQRYEFTAENVQTILNREIGLVFARVLEDAGVFKQTTDGQAAFKRFVGQLN